MRMSNTQENKIKIKNSKNIWNGSVFLFFVLFRLALGREGERGAKWEGDVEVVVKVGGEREREAGQKCLVGKIVV